MSDSERSGRETSQALREEAERVRRLAKLVLQPDVALALRAYAE